MSETVYIAIITGGTALLATIVGQWLTRIREERIEALKWQRQQGADTKNERAQSARSILKNVLLTRERIQVLMPNLEHPGSVVSSPESSAGASARHAYGEALLCSSVLRPRALAFYQTSIKLESMLESKDGVDEAVLHSAVKAWVVKTDEMENALAEYADHTRPH